MKSFKSHSLRTKIILSLILITTLFVGVFQGYAYVTLKSKMYQELNEAADQKIVRLSHDIEIPMWELDEMWIKKLLDSELTDENVHAISVSGTDDISVSIDRDHESNTLEADHSEEDEYEHDIIRSSPILHNGVQIGEIKLFMTRALVQQRINQEFIDTLIVTFFEIFIVIASLWIMIKHVVLSPIETLMHSTQRIADGNYSHAPLDLAEDEIGALGKSIAQMKNKIQLRESELVQNNHELKMLKERLEYAIHGAQEGLWDWNLETNEVYFSPRWKEMLGYKEDELTNSFETWIALMHPDDIEKAKESVAQSQRNEEQFYENIHRLRHKNGSWVWILTRGQTIFNEARQPIRMVGFHTDITTQKQLENELLEKEELMIAQSRHVAMGEMIGMIAHQWRQPITVIAMGANNMLADIALEQVVIEEFKYEAQQILKQTEYLSKTIDDFRTFFRPNKEKDQIKVLDVLLEAKQIMGKSLENHNIDLSFEDRSNETILTYSRELLQVVLNLLKNSKEALETNKIENAYINVNVESDSDSVIITVCDNGGGINEAIINRIFDPYFSTKDTKTGTGLGLYMSKTIIEKHLKGNISAKNTYDGVCLTIELPKHLNGDFKNE